MGGTSSPNQLSNWWLLGGQRKVGDLVRAPPKE